MDVGKLSQDILSQLRSWDVREIPETIVVYQEGVKAGRRSRIQKGNIAFGGSVHVVIKSIDTAYISNSKERGIAAERLLAYFKRECRIWRDLGRHENIAPLLGFVLPTEKDILPSLVMQYYPLRDLRSFVVVQGERISLQKRALLMLGVAKGLSHMHSRQPPAVHRDLKGNNILIEVLPHGGLNARISDFGSAKLTEIHSEVPGGTSQFATLNWSPPEHIVLKDGRLNLNVKYATKEADVWSYACTFLEVLKEADPWPGTARIEKELSKGHHPPRPESMDIDDHLWIIMEECWLPKPAVRLSARLIVDKLKSALLVTNGEMHQGNMPMRKLMECSDYP